MSILNANQEVMV